MNLSPRDKIKFFLTLGLALGSAFPACWAFSLYEDGLRISESAQAQLQNELEKSLGKGRATALVRINLEMDPRIREAITRIFIGAPPQNAGGIRGEAPGSAQTDSAKTEFLWKQQKSEPKSFVLPGFPAKKMEKEEAQAGAGPDKRVKSPQEKLEGPDPALVLAAGTMVRKITVKISLDPSLPPDAEEAAASIARTFIDLNPNRGDVLSIQRAPMPSPFMDIFMNSEALLKTIHQALWIVLAAVMMLALSIVIISFGKTIQRSADKIAGSIVAGLRQSNMDIGLKYQNSPGSDSNPAGQGPALPNDQNLLTDSPESGDASESPISPAKQKMLFNIGLDQVGDLYQLLNHENPDNIALVLSYLRADARQAFLSRLPQSVTAAVMNSLSSVRFVEPDIILRLKSELEHRLLGAVGGIDQVVELIQGVDGKTRRELMNLLAQRNPDLAKGVREKIFFLEDILLISDEELRQALPLIKIDELALAVVKEGPCLAKVQKCMSVKVQQVLQETLSFMPDPPEEKIVKAQDKIVLLLQKLVAEGKIKRPLAKALNENQLLADQSSGGIGAVEKERV